MKQSFQLLFLLLIYSTAVGAQKPTSRVNVEVDSSQNTLFINIRNMTASKARISLINADGQPCAAHRFEAAHRQKLNIVCQDLGDGHYTVVIKTHRLLIRRPAHIVKGKVRLGAEQFFSGTETVAGR